MPRVLVEAGGGRAVLDSELLINALEMFAHCARRNPEDFGHLSVRFSGREPVQDFIFSDRQLPVAPFRFSTAFLYPLQEQRDGVTRVGPLPVDKETSVATPDHQDVAPGRARFGFPANGRFFEVTFRALRSGKKLLEPAARRRVRPFYLTLEGQL